MPCFTQQRKTMPKLKLLHIIIIILSCFSSFCQACNQIDQDSLVSLRQIHLINSNPSLNIGLLLLIAACEEESFVTKMVVLPNRGLSGIISPSIGNLIHLYHLKLSHICLSCPLHASSFCASYSSYINRI